jgi:uncharacterized protein YggU (UPF0235/DUF167 family)
MNSPQHDPARSARVYSKRQGGITLSVRLTPKGGADRIDGITTGPDGPALKARVSAPPEKGKANTALEKLIAAWLSIPGSMVEVAGGQKSRNKTVLVYGETAELTTRAESKLAALASDQ